MIDSTTSTITVAKVRSAVKESGDMANDSAPLQAAFNSEAKVRFIEIEKNLISMGFFTPSSKRLEAVEQKTVSLSRYLYGRRVETSATIIPSRLYGLPVTADQDKYLALQYIVSELKRKYGKVSNPIGFTAASLLRILGKAKSGKSYDEVLEWMRLMTATTINAQVYFAGRKSWVDDTFHVFDRAIAMGKEMPDGSVADRNYVWLSDWQLENINAHYQFPIDLHSYFQLRSHIAKGLVPLLQIWLHASVKRGRFEKSYADLCQILNIKQYQHVSKLKLGLGPSLDELVKHSYLAAWSIETTAHGEFKIVFTHGAKFFSDRELRSGVSSQLAIAASPMTQELVSRGIQEDLAKRLISTLPPEQPIRDQLEYGDHVLRSAPRGAFRNPPGFYVYLLRDGVLPPAGFETSRMRQQRELADARSQEESVNQARHELAYDDYRRRAIDEYFVESVCEKERMELIESSRRDVRAHFPESSRWPPQTVEDVAMQRLKAQIADRVDLMSFDEFCKLGYHQMDLFSTRV